MNTESAEYPHSARQSAEHRLILTYFGKRSADISRWGIKQNSAVFHNKNLIGNRKDLLKPVLNQNNRKPQLPIKLLERCDEISRGYRVQLTCRLIKNQYFGLHYHNRSQIQKLLLTARKLVRIFAEPAFYSEIARHFPDPSANHLGWNAHIFKTEGKLVPNLIGHYLIIGILKNITDLTGAHFFVKLLLQNSLIIYFSAYIARRSQFPFEQFEQSSFAAARFAADNYELPAFKRQIYALHRILFRFGITEAQILDTQYFHTRASFTSIINGQNDKIPNAA